MEKPKRSSILWLGVAGLASAPAVLQRIERCGDDTSDIRRAILDEMTGRGAFADSVGRCAVESDEIVAGSGRRGVDESTKCPVSGKRKYETEGDALATAAHQMSDGEATKELRAYRCNWCATWHLTKNAGKAGQDSK